MDKPELTDFDKKLWHRELEDFVPGSIFDFHTHLWSEEFAGANLETGSPLRMDIDLAALRTWSDAIFPGRHFGFLTLPTPLTGIDIAGHNRWIVEQAGRYTPPSRDFPVFTAVLITPDMKPEDLQALASNAQVAALKPYRSFAADPADARITDFFPEKQMEVADALGLAVVLHLSKVEGPADRDNLIDLETFTRRYSNIKWVLAHCARAFNPVFLEESIHILKNLPSTWIDTSAVNDSYSHYLLFKHFDRKRILFGTDNVSAGSYRGKYITYGYAWEGYAGKGELEHCDPRATFVVYEQLRCQKQAAIMAGLSAAEVEEMFSGNAGTLLGIEGVLS
jgi:hypothetical protein